MFSRRDANGAGMQERQGVAKGRRSQTGLREDVEVGDGVTDEEKSKWRPEDKPTLRGVNRGVVESLSVSVRKGDSGGDQGARGGQALF